MLTSPSRESSSNVIWIRARFSSTAALATVPFIGFDREAPTRKAIDKLFREKNLELTPVMEMDNVETIKRAVELGLGCTVLPAATVQYEVSLGTLVVKPFAEGSVTRPIDLSDRTVSIQT